MSAMRTVETTLVSIKQLPGLWARVQFNHEMTFRCPKLLMKKQSGGTPDGPRKLRDFCCLYTHCPPVIVHDISV